MPVKISWFRIDEETKFLWEVKRGVYAYLSPQGEILYIGKVDGTTVKRRAQPSAKPALWNFIGNELGYSELEVIVGLIKLPKGYRLTSQLICDIESLLIFEIKPAGNIACRNSRISRPGLSVQCSGYWNYFKRRFFDKQ